MTGSRASQFVAGAWVDGRYLLEELIGRGGTAEVYRARDDKTGRHVALKHALSSGEAHAGYRRLHLEREYHTLAQLAHPRIIEVYAYGITDVGAYYTMELLDVGDLANGGKWAWPNACALLVDVASSLSILHSRGLLHRDVSARNVRRGRDERAKLIDFGALSSMGVAREVVGTPPYVPPEALQMQLLDARADLFALGALAYYLLTGRHAFGARKLSELRDVWRSSPVPLSRIAPEAPAALSSMIMQLLSLDRMARPSSAADVMRRLCAIAKLPMDEDVAVSRAYLSMPVLVGRDELQVASRKALLRLTQGQGATLLVEGAEGTGRTRALDTCVLDGRLLGAHVARADASSSGTGDWAVARALCTQLSESLPAQAAVALQPLAPWLGPIMGELQGKESGDLTRIGRNALIRGLRDFVLALGQRERLLLAVDDVDEIDEPSRAFLSALASHAEGRSIAIALTLDVESRSRPELSLSLLREHAQTVELQPLTAAQTEALLRSVFGELSHVPLLAGRVHAIARGYPRDILELAQHLATRGLARYEAGAWSLPADISEIDLPTNLACALLARVTALPPDARELAELTAVTELPGMMLEQYELLCSNWDRARLFAALQELVAARMLRSAEHYAWTQHGLSRAVRDAMPPERFRRMHARWADVLEASGGDPLLRVHHLFEAGRLEQSVELLLQLDLQVRQPNLPLLERVVAQSKALRLPARSERELRLGLLTAALLALKQRHFVDSGPAALADLARDSGLRAYAELGQLPEAARVAQAIAMTEAMQRSAPAHARGYSVEEAVARLLRLSTAYGVMALSSFDPTLLSHVPDIAPLVAHSTLAAQTLQLMLAADAWLTGRLGQALEIYTALLEQRNPHDPTGPSQALHPQLVDLCHLLAGVLKAGHGIPAAEEHARAVERVPMLRANAWHIRQLFHLSQGNQFDAASCGRQADLLKVQQGAEQQAATRTESVLLAASVRIGDLAAVRAALAQVEPLAAQHPGWEPVLLYGQAEYAALQGDWPNALALAERGLSITAAGQHLSFCSLAAVRVQALCALGRADEACREAQRYYAEIEQARALPAPLLSAALAHALSSVGRHAEASERIARALHETSQLGMTGSLPGYLHETAAYVALAAGDAQCFERSFAACASEYRQGDNSVLGGRLARLFDAAHKQQLHVAQLAGLLDEAGLHVTVGAEQTRLRSRFGECLDRVDRAHCALSLVLAQSERSSGYLFGLVAGRLVPWGGIPSDHACEEVVTWVQSWFARLSPASNNDQATETLSVETDSDVDITQTEPGDEGAVPNRLQLADGLEFEAVLMPHAHDANACAGVFVLSLGGVTRVMPSRYLLGSIAELLQAHGDLPAGPRDVR